ncbi:Rne/Rng family ribonuclease [Georgenia sp. AZ-5]|uniref:Rne/Rng family ribonuclease n=1 Tax=Georgenia sp. AZ-5 TaxID=3367526 RepID=UPI0037540F53
MNDQIDSTTDGAAEEQKPTTQRRSRSRRATSPAGAPSAAQAAAAQGSAAQGSAAQEGGAPAAAEPGSPEAAAPGQPAAADAAQAEPAAAAPAKKTTRTRRAPAKKKAAAGGTDAAAAEAAGGETAGAEPQAAAEPGAAPAEAAETAPAKKPRTRRAPAKKATAPAEPATDPAAAEAAAEDSTAPVAVAEDSTTPVAVAQDSAAPAAEKPKTTRTRRKKAAPAAAEEPPAAQPAAAPAETTAVTAEVTQPATGPVEGSGDELAGPAPAELSPHLAVEEVETAANGEAAAKKPGRRSRRATAPARSSGQKLDVLAELGVAKPADEEDEEESSAGAVTAATAETAGESAPTPNQAEEDGGPRLAATALLFQAPDPTKARTRRRRAQSPAGAPPVEAEAPGTTEAEPAEAEEAEAPESAEEEHAGGRRRRRRGGRGRRNRSQQEAAEDETTEEESAAESAESPEEASEAEGETETEEEEGTSGSRRRRRRRRSGRSAEAETGGRARDEVTALKGSTRLEAKRQRRREGREAGRRRPTITESEFLARREAVARTMVVREKDGLNQIAVLEDGILVEHYVARHTQTSMVGNVYLGRVQNVLPSMEAAFVDLGKGRNAVLYAGEVNWDAAGMEGQPRRIEQALKSGDSVLVQVTKDPIGHKGARLTSQITLAGRHLVLVPSGAMTGISRKLPENERARLKKLLKEIVPAGAGVIVRTAAEGASEEQLRADVERLTRQWADIEARAKSAKSAPVLLKGEPELAVRVVRDVFNEDFERLVVSGDGAWETISGYVRELSPDLAHRMHHWTSQQDVFSEYRVDEQLAKGMDRKVWLPSGGSLVIDRTEAMTVIDVNTGKFTGSGGTLEETVTRNNLEAAEEIVRQLRLRDIGGIIVIDFIDMVLESNRDLVMRRLLECLGRDRTRHQVAEVTSLGLVQMTRKRVGQGLVEAFSTPCEHCGGRGFVVHEQPVEKSGTGNGVEENGSRRRGRKGGAAPAPEPVAEPARAEDPGAAAAREAVKATLATIAAAAAKGHQEHEHDDAHKAPAKPPRTGVLGDEAALLAGVDASEAANVVAAAEVTGPEQGDVVAAELAADTGTVPAPVDEAAAQQAAAAAPAKAPVRAEAANEAPATAAAPVTAPAEEAPAAPAPKRARRSRRAVSSGVVTPGETKIITLDLPQR